MLTEVNVNSSAGRSRIEKELQRGKTTGKYHLSTFNLAKVPEELYSDKQLGDVKFWEEVATHSLNLSHNQLQELPSQLSALADLKSLDVSHNKLSSLVDISFPDLLSLDIRNNAIRALPILSAAFPGLQKLTADRNPLSELNLGSLSDLVELSAEKCQLRSEPSELENCVLLTKLYLASNKIGAFTNVQALVRLAELDLSQNSMQGAVPSMISTLTALKSLKLSQNGLTSLPVSISRLSALTELSLGFNSFTELPEGLSKLTSMHSLDFRDNQISKFPGCILSLHSLSSVDARNNSIQSLPPEIGLMPNLKLLSILGNPVKGIRPTLLNASVRELQAFLRSRLEEVEDEQGGEYNKPKAWSVSHGLLTLAGGKFEMVPAEVQTLADQIKTLDLSGCGLKQLNSGQISTLTQLQRLILARNLLTDWPMGRSEEALRLQYLDVSDNPLRCVPCDALEGCSNTLTSLSLSGVKAVGISMCGFLGSALLLRDLDLGRTGLSDIPDVIFSLRDLQTLNVSSNSISEVPQQLTVLACLSRLDLSANSIAKVPPQLGVMHPTLKQLALDGNPLRTIRQAVLQKGTPALLEYLRGRIPGQ